MIPWYAPANVKTWRRRLVSPRAMVLALVFLGIIISEFRFDWMEKTAGAYLVTTNAHRPKSGTIWEQGLMVDSARQELTQFADQRQQLQQKVREAESLAQVIDTIEQGKGAMISAEHFLSLYLKLPPVLSTEIISPYTLLTFTCSGQWQRAYLEREDNQVQVYLLDAKSQVVHRLIIGSALIGYIERGEVAIRTGLDQLSDFKSSVYDPDQFFDALNALPEEQRRRVLPHPETLLRISGRIHRIGISETAVGNVLDIGFEVEDVQGLKVILVQGIAADVRRLQYELSGSAFGWPWGRELSP